MASKDFPLSLTIKAVDQASGPLQKIAFNAGAFAGGLNKKFAGFGGKLGTVFGGLRSVGSEVSALGLKLGGIGLAASAVFGKLIHDAVEHGDKLSEMADRVGMNVDAYASLQHAAAQADIEQEAFNQGMGDFAKKLGQAKAGSGKLLSFLNQVSPSLAKQVKGAKTSEAALSLMTDAMVRLQDPTKRAALAQAAFGDAAFGNFLHQGGAAIQAQQAEHMKLVGSQEQSARAAGELDNALKKLGDGLVGMRTAAFGPLMPVFTRLTNLATDFIVKNRDGILKWAEGAAKAIEDWVNGGGFDRLVGWFGKVFDVISSVWDLIGGFKGALVVVGAVMAGPLLSSILTLVPALWGLAAPLAPFVLAASPFITAGLAIVAAGRAIYDNWEPLKAMFADLWESITWEFGKAWEKIRPIMDKVSDFFGLTAGGLKVYKDGADAYAPKTSVLAPGANFSAPRSTRSEAKVTVDFNNAPSGTRVNVDKSSTAPVDYSLGPMMSAGN